MAFLKAPGATQGYYDLAGSASEEAEPATWPAPNPFRTESFCETTASTVEGLTRSFRELFRSRHPLEVARDLGQSGSQVMSARKLV